MPSRLACLAALVPLLGGQDARAPREDLTELVARDGRLSFGADAGARARAVLESAPEEVEARAVAAVALGCAGAGAERARLEAMLADGRKTEQRAALFALGELGPAGWSALDQARARAGGLELPLALALIVSERRGCTAAAEALRECAAGDDELARAARAALDWRERGEPGALADLLELYYGLRWRAAKSYGLVDGARWQRTVAARLFADEGFLDRAVLGAAAELSKPELEAHLTEILLAGEDLAALRVATLVMPDDLALAIQTKSWTPTTAAWRTLLGTIEAERSERAARKLVELGFRAAPELEPLAGLLIFRAGGDLPWVWIGDQLERGEAPQRVALVEACGDRGEKARIPDLSDLLERRKDLGLTAPGLVALVRLGHQPAKEALDELLEGPESKSRSEALAALARVLHDPHLWRTAERARTLTDLAPEARLQLELALALSGARVEHDRLRELLPLAPRGARRIGLVRALGEKPEPADLAALAEMFPDEDDLELDVELARVLLRERHPAMAGLLTAALWREPWNRSVLAGGLIVRSGGTQALVDELDGAPRTARESDLRRVGFALGEWGGLPAVDELARTRSEGDPALQGAVLGALASRANPPEKPARVRPPADVALPGSRPAPAKPAPRGKGGKKGRKGG